MPSDIAVNDKIVILDPWGGQHIMIAYSGVEKWHDGRDIVWCQRAPGVDPFPVLKVECRPATAKEVASGKVGDGGPSL